MTKFERVRANREPAMIIILVAGLARWDGLRRPRASHGV